MFMRYTCLGIGHPAALRRITRDCLGSDIVVSPHTMDIGEDSDGDLEGFDGSHEEGEDGEDDDEESDDEESDDDLSGGEQDEDENDEFDELSF